MFGRLIRPGVSFRPEEWNRRGSGAREIARQRAGWIKQVEDAAKAMPRALPAAILVIGFMLIGLEMWGIFAFVYSLVRR